MNISLGYMRIDRQIAVMIEQQMKFDCSLGLPVLRPVVHLRHRSMTLASRLKSLFLKRSVFLGAEALCYP